MSKDIVKPGEETRRMDIWVTGRLIEWAAGRGKNEELKRDFEEELDGYAAELAGSMPSPLESLLARTAALNWFALRLAEAQFAGGAMSEGGLTINQSDHHQRRIDRAHRRLMETVKTLATVRRLGLPSIQVNVARQQVNVSGGTS